MIKKKHKGAFSELKASAWLLNQGYEVFRNVSPHGAVDIIAMNPETNEITLIDVKTTNNNYILKKESLNNIRYLSVNYDTGECSLG